MEADKGQVLVALQAASVIIRVGQKIKIFDLGFPIRRAFAEWC